jgi:single-stranded-DNA-specific exonuclease
MSVKKTISRRPLGAADQSLCSAISPLLQRIYHARGIVNDTELQKNLADLQRPTMKGLTQAVDILAAAVQQQQSILIVGDFDCDGATSSALAVLALRALGLQRVDFLVPNRFKYGYGLTPEIVAEAAKSQPDIIVTVDNGIASIDGVEAANNLGITVVVTDHHLQGDELPNAAAIVNPNQHGCDFPSKNLAGVGVIFYVMSALRTALRQRAWFTHAGIAEPNMADFLDLVALGTVADVVPLDHNNRILVHQGLLRIRAGRARAGILALLDVAGRERHRLVASDLGFAIGPRLNAAGRLDDMALGINCLLTDNPDAARNMAVELDDLNHDRKAIESSMQAEAMASLKQISLVEADMPWGLTMFDATWHQGVIGILASRIKDRYHRPVIAFAEANETEIKGSARSIPGLHIRDALDAVAKRQPELLSKFGGHAMAAGMSLKKEHYPAFAKAFDAEVRRQLTTADLQAEVLSDGELSAPEFTMQLAQELREGGPWGQHFPEPLFDGEFYIVQQRIVGEKHLKLVLCLNKGGHEIIDAIAFNVDLEIWPNSCEKLHAVFKLDINEYRGRQTLQLMLDYLEPR